MAKGKTIIFEPIAGLGNTVYHKTDEAKEFPYIVTQYCILYIDENGEVKDYTLACSASNGALIYFKPFELKLQEEVNKQ